MFISSCHASGGSLSNSRQLDDGLCHPGLEPGSSPCATFLDPGSVPGMTKQRR
ncbi:MAG: hypothetical protein JKY15_08470 [Deltaproteobacteria bacterium]|nr:hypothetical protein [Deltaproteobacteria bacterium]